VSDKTPPRGLVTRALVGLVIQLGCLAMAVYVIVSDGALPGASWVARAGVAFVCLAVSVTYGEVLRQRETLRQFIQALQAQVGAGAPRDDRRAVDTLVSALGSADESTREMAHKHLMRLTGKDLPPDPLVWETWWKSARSDFRAGGGSSG